MASASENLPDSLVQWSQSQVWEENACGKRNRIYELSKTMKKEYAFLALTQMPIILVDDL